MNPNDTTDPAFIALSHSQSKYPGLTKREYFAAMAMQGLLASGCVGSETPDDIAETSTRCAESLIKELNK